MQIQMLEHVCWQSCQRHTYAWASELAIVLTWCGIVCVVLFVKVSVGGVVFHGDDAGKVFPCVRQEGRLMALVKGLTLASQISEHAGSYLNAEVVQVWRIENLEQSAAWYESADGLLTVVR